MSGVLLPLVRFTGWNDVGDPIPGGLLSTFASGTTTPQPTYTNAALTVPNTNPIVLDAAGRAVVFLAPGVSYTITLRTATGVLVWSQDDVGGSGSGGTGDGGGDVLGTAGETLGLDAVVYLSNGTPNPVTGTATIAGRWYLATAVAIVDAVTALQATNTTPVIGMTQAPIANGQPGAVRTAGVIAGLVGLTAGTVYYVGLNGGLTPIAPTLWPPRVVGVAASTTTLILTANPSPVTTSLPIVQTFLSTGGQDIALTPGCDVLVCTISSGTPGPLVINGLSPGFHGQELLIVPDGVTTQILYLAHQASATLTWRLVLQATSANTPIAAGGSARLRYDVTVGRWILVAHDQGAWISPTVVAGDFTALAPMLWTVQVPGDVAVCRFRLQGSTLHVRANLVTTTIGAAVSTMLRIGSNAYGGFLPAVTVVLPCAASFNDNAGGVQVAGYVQAIVATAFLNVAKLIGANFTTGTNLIDVYVDCSFLVT